MNHASSYHLLFCKCKKKKSRIFFFVIFSQIEVNPNTPTESQIGSQDQNIASPLIKRKFKYKEIYLKRFWKMLFSFIFLLALAWDNILWAFWKIRSMKKLLSKPSLSLFHINKNIYYCWFVNQLANISTYLNRI